MIPKLDAMFRLDAASSPDVRRLSGPAAVGPPSEWTTASPHELTESWKPHEAGDPWVPPSAVDLGPAVDEWDAGTTGHTGYTAGSKSWKLDVDLPNGWYTRIVERT